MSRADLEPLARGMDAVDDILSGLIEIALPNCEVKNLGPGHWQICETTAPGHIQIHYGKTFAEAARKVGNVYSS